MATDIDKPAEPIDTALAKFTNDLATMFEQLKEVRKTRPQVVDAILRVIGEHLRSFPPPLDDTGGFPKV